MLCGVRQALRDDVVDRSLDRRRGADPSGHIDDLDGEGGAGGERFERRPEAELAQDRRMQAAREFSQLLHRLRELVRGLVQHDTRSRRVGLEHLLDQP